MSAQPPISSASARLGIECTACAAANTMSAAEVVKRCGKKAARLVVLPSI
jgi:hypothetical protein